MCGIFVADADIYVRVVKVFQFFWGFRPEATEDTVGGGLRISRNMVYTSAVYSYSSPVESYGVDAVSGLGCLTVKIHYKKCMGLRSAAVYTLYFGYSRSAFHMSRSFE